VTATDAPREAEIGRVRHRKEDAHLITGATTWTDNIQMPGMLYMYVVRSPMAHARLRSVDVSEALTQPGVIAAYTGADLADSWTSPMPCAWPVNGATAAPHWPLAQDRVRFVGDAVAVVLARSAETAADAAEHVFVDYEPLPAVLDMEAALTDEVLVDDVNGTNSSFTWTMTNGSASAIDDAPVRVTRRIVNHRLIPTAMEPRSVVAAPMPVDDSITLYSATQIPHFIRIWVPVVTGLSESKFRVIAPDVGGGFGSKLEFYVEEALAVQLARRLGHPIKWTATRREDYQATIHGRDQIQDLTLAAETDGRLRGIRVNIMANMGGYLALVAPGVPILGAQMFNGIYKMDAYDFSVTGVLTNTSPTDAYRGAGRPEATHAIERMMDELAVELDMDPIELRRRNWIGHDEFPYTTVAGMTYDTGNYEAATDRALELFDYEGLRREQSERRQRGDRVQLGIGVSTYTEACGFAPSRIVGALDYGAGGWETATVRVLFSGKVEVFTGVSPHGQGHETTFSQVVADVLGVPFEDIEIRHGDTQASPYGLDTYGSRSLAVGGVAIYNAAKRLIEQYRPAAAHMLEAAPDDLEYVDGAFRVQGSPEATVSLAQVTQATIANHDMPDDYEPTVTAQFTFEPENWSFPHGTHLCAAEIDTETGETHIRSYVAVDDVGTIVNPQVVEGQVHGGIAQGMAQALWEEAVYDGEGNLVTSSLVDYYVPSAADMPSFETAHTETPATSNPLGVKGVGETGTIASTPAVVNAVLDAIRHLGVRDIDMPCSPERVWRALRDGAATREHIAPERAEGGQQ